MGTPGDPLKKNDPESTFKGQAFMFGEDDTRPGARYPLARQELLARVTALLQSCDGCERVAAIDVTPLEPPDNAGCNWSMAIVLDPAGVAPEVYALAYASVIVTARERWNLR